MKRYTTPNEIPRLKYGNCLIGALLIKKHFKGKGKLVNMCRGEWVMPHFAVLYKGSYYSYSIIEDIFPMPFALLVFKGRFIKQKQEHL